MNERIIAQAVDAVIKGNLIVYPTDTLYALGAGISRNKAILKIFSVKKRPRSLPLPLAVSDWKQLESLVFLTPLAEKLANAFFPGKITIICQKKPHVSDVITAKEHTVAVRIPDDSVALHLLKKTGPLITTSANWHGQTTPKTISEIRKLFKPDDVEVYVDDGPRQGKPSTIVDVTGTTPKILREGCIPTSSILDMSEI